MKVLLVEANKRPRAIEIDGSLESMQKVVGGLIQSVYIDNDVTLICNEEGKLINLQPNRSLRNEDDESVEIIAGTFFICSAPADSENFEGLTDEQIDTYTKMFYGIENFIETTSGLHITKY